MALGILKKIILFFCLFVSNLIHGSIKFGVDLMVLGVAQDAGYPQLNCYKPHCQAGWGDPKDKKYATSLAVVDYYTETKFYPVTKCGLNVSGKT